MSGGKVPVLTICAPARLPLFCETACRVHGDASAALLRVVILGLDGNGDIVRVAPVPGDGLLEGGMPQSGDVFFGADNCIRVAEAVAVARVSGSARLAFRVVRAGDDVVPIDALFLPVAGDAEGAVCELALVATGDAAASTIGQHFRFLEQAAADARDGLIVTDRNGSIVHVGAGATLLFGYEPAELIGRNVSMLMPEPYRSRHDQYVGNFHATGRGKILGIGPRELPARHRDGSIFPIELSVSEAEWNGQKMFIGLCRDISARMERERALQDAQATLSESVQKLEAANSELARRQDEVSALADRLKTARDEARGANRAKTDFLATMSHEIRTPLNGVIGMAQVLAATKLDAEQRDHLAVILESSETLLGLLNELLDLSKIESGRMTLEPRDTELAKFLSPILEHWRQRAEAKGLEFCVVRDPGLPTRATFDPVRLRQVLDNLLSNAIKFTDTGSVSLDICAREFADDGHGLEFAVADSGIGIKPENLGSVFDSFTQADSSITRRFGGTGLGLAITKRLVELMTGTIAVESTLGAGTRFTVTLPCRCAPGACTARPATAAAQQVETTVPHAVPDAGEGLDVLVAEDNAVNQKVIKTILAALGHRATLAGNGLEAIAELDAGKQFDLILMDLHMPEMDGLAATQAIRARGGAMASVPIIGLTASAMERDRETCLQAGMSDFVTKPIKIDALAFALGQAASGASEAQEAITPPA